MSINVEYLGDGRIRVTCGAITAYVPLEPPTEHGAAPVAEPPPRSPVAPAPVPDERSAGTPSAGSPLGGAWPRVRPRRRPVVWPKPPPGVGVVGMMTIDAEGPGTHQAWEWMFDGSDLSLPIEDMLGRSPLDLRQRIAALSGRVAGFDHRPLFLNVAVRPSPHTGPIDLEQLQAIVADRSIGLEGIRLLFMADDETG